MNGYSFSFEEDIVKSRREVKRKAGEVLREDFLSFFNEQVLVRLETRENNRPRAGGYQFSLEFLSQNLEEFDAAGAEVGASIDGVGDKPPLLADKESRLNKIGMIGRMGEIEEIKVFHA